MSVFSPFMLALAFLNCRNVGTIDVEQPAALSKKWQRKHGRPLVRYKVLDVGERLVRPVRRAAVVAEEQSRALHICRGHFATYTEEAPLFGRLTGTFWKPQHVRGSAKSGAVVKDYRVKAPR